jgi:hypothetical protein
VHPVPPSPFRYMPYVLVGWFAAGLVVVLIARARRVPAILDVDAQVRLEAIPLDPEPADAEI